MFDTRISDAVKADLGNIKKPKQEHDEIAALERRIECKEKHMAESLTMLMVLLSLAAVFYFGYIPWIENHFPITHYFLGLSEKTQPLSLTSTDRILAEMILAVLLWCAGAVGLLFAGVSTLIQFGRFGLYKDRARLTEL